MHISHLAGLVSSTLTITVYFVLEDTLCMYVYALRLELLIFRCKCKIIEDQKRLCNLPCLCLHFVDGIHWPLAAPVLHECLDESSLELETDLRGYVAIMGGPY